jgi:hypothetical protein
MRSCRSCPIRRGFKTPGSKRKSVENRLGKRGQDLIGMGSGLGLIPSDFDYAKSTNRVIHQRQLVAQSPGAGHFL